VTGSDLGRLGIWFFLDAMPAPETAAFARRLEQKGYRALWVPEAVGREPFAHAGYMLSGTERLVLATGIANVWARDAFTMAAASKTVAELSGGRFVLGIGVSHEPLVADLRGHAYDRPYTYMKGSEDRIRARIDAHLAAGATHVCILPLRADGSPLPDERAVDAFAPRGAR
jgi:alkanesulfonate monooxygenase SsuD/methylene tetrahydromethanopterin reductase-like flavin-dependent oxidoreductase (luciferase family)